MKRIAISLLRFSGMVVCFLVICFATACSEENNDDGVTAHDPSQPITITDFIPKSGGAGQRLVIFGSNFGCDTSIVQVLIGGKEAKVIGLNGESLYCLVPEKSYEGGIEIRIGDGDNKVISEASEKFEYQRKTVVSTLCGEEDENGDYKTIDGPFSDCGGFKNPSWLSFDPQNPQLLYIAQDGGNVRLLNFQDSTVTTPITRGMGNWDRIRTIDWTIDGEYMIISNDQGGENDISTSILSRTNNFSDPQAMTRYRQCNGASIHPINGELYFNSYEKGQFFRYDMERYFNGELGVKDYEELFKIQDNSWEFNIRIHPTGNYAYIIVINRHYILRTDYNWETKRFTQPYLVCGEPRVSGWVDGVGTKARLNTPYQGVFVKNPEYEGLSDEYDFYFTEQHNHDIRILTPEGKVTTFAGRGSTSVNSNPWGYIDGDLRLEARFDQPKGLAYDEVNHVFYVGDVENHRIRKIALEEEN
ncbi:IPT/TIG domain-containing protein [Thermophagus sp. OGC60D27]|uniref:IPT/TIG domain-containing protein n=1 Tax=Thermophagus sp. OGC60D27 TaxID=3458415 RepID=UPI004038283E